MLMSLEIRAAAAVGGCKSAAVVPAEETAEAWSERLCFRCGALSLTPADDGVSTEEAAIGLAAARAFERFAGLRRKGVAGMDLGSLDMAFCTDPLGS